MSLNRDILFIGVDGGDRNFATVTMTGPVFLAPGTVTNPSLAFAGDRNTGLYNPAQDALGVAVGGVQNAYFVGTHLLLGGLTTDGTGVLQFPAGAADNTSGLTFGANVSIYRSGVDMFEFRGVSTMQLRMAPGGSLRGYWTCNGTTNTISSNVGSLVLASGDVAAITLDSSQNATFAKKIINYNGAVTAGNGVLAPVANPRQTAVTNTTATLATYTVPATDSSFYISANVQVTATTTAAMTVVCTYTDETNTSRAQTIPFVQLAGTFLTSITNVTGAGPYEGATLQIRCKASTTIVFTTAGTVTGITYNVEGIVTQAA